MDGATILEEYDIPSIAKTADPEIAEQVASDWDAVLSFADDNGIKSVGKIDALFCERCLAVARGVNLATPLADVGSQIAHPPGGPSGRADAPSARPQLNAPTQPAPALAVSL